jgi:hypothetical protein
MRLILICLGTLLISFLIWSTLWAWARGFTYEPYSHPLTSWSAPEGAPLLALQSSSLEEARAFLLKNPDQILLLELYMSEDGLFFTAPAQKIGEWSRLSQESPEFKRGNKHYYYSFSFIQAQLGDSIRPLEDWLALRPRFWILKIQDNALDVDRRLIEWVEKNSFQDRAVVTSEIDLIVTSLKDQRPLWVYGSSRSDLVKLLTLTSVHLGGLANFKRDFFFTPVTLQRRSVLNEEVVKEMKRRFKKVVIGPVHTDQDRAEALRFHPDILILGSALTQGSNN